MSSKGRIVTEVEKGTPERLTTLTVFFIAFYIIA